MAGIKVTDLQRQQVKEFVTLYTDLFHTIVMHYSYINVQEMFDKLNDQIKIRAGSIYLCFSCASVLNKKEVPNQKFFQINHRWHDCQTKYNGVVVPTIGVFTQWQKLLDYIETIDMNDLRKVLQSFK